MLSLLIVFLQAIVVLSERTLGKSLVVSGVIARGVVRAKSAIACELSQGSRSNIAHIIRSTRTRVPAVEDSSAASASLAAAGFCAGSPVTLGFFFDECKSRQTKNQRGAVFSVKPCYACKTHSDYCTFSDMHAHTQLPLHQLEV